MAASFPPALCRVALITALCLGAAVGTWVPGEVQATEQTGKLRGSVKDAEGEPLVGVTLTAVSESMQGAKEVQTSADGGYWLPGLPPGVYDLRAELSGYQTYIRKGIRVSIGQTLDVDITMTLATVSTVVTITDERPVLDVASSTTGAVVTREYLEALPTRRSYQGAAQAAPGVTGGANPNVKGGSSSENKWLLDGGNVTDPVTGTFSFNFNLDAIEEIEVITGNFRAENGASMGGIVNVRSRSGSNTFSGNVNAYYQNGNWSPRRDAVYTPDGRQIESSEFDRDNQNFDFNAAIGGPIVKNKLWFFGSLKYIHNVSTAAGARSPRVFDGFNFFGKLTANPHPAHRLIFAINSSPASISNQSQSLEVTPDAQNHQSQNSITINAEEEWTITRGLVAKIKYNHIKEAIESTPQPCTWRDDLRFKQCKEGQEEGYIDFITPGRLGARSANWTENYYAYSLNDRYRDTVLLTLTGFVPRALGSHEIKGGLELSWVRAERAFGYTGNLYYVDYLEDTGDPNSTVNGYWRETGGQLFERHTGSTIFAFLQDSWEPVRGLTIDVGVKYDRSTMRNDVGERIVGFDFVSPVAGFAWDPTRRKRAKIYLGGGITIDQSRLGISAFLDKNGLGRKLYLGEFFTTGDANNSYELYSWDRGQSNYEKLQKLTVPRVYRMDAGFEVLLGAATKVGIEGTAKWFRHLWEDDEVNYIWTGTGTNTIGVINGLQSYFFRLRTPFDGQRNYYSLTLRLERRMYKNLLLDINYTMSITRGLTATAITAALDNPTQRPYEYGWLYTDRPHVVKASAAYRLPFGLQIGGTFNFFSGSRFDRQYYNDKGGYDNYVAERGDFDSVDPYWSIDLKLLYRLRLPKGGLFVTAELYNLTNNRAARGISTSALNSRGEYYATSRQPPMELQLGLGYDF